jgi:hypothetical protein
MKKVAKTLSFQKLKLTVPTACLQPGLISRAFFNALALPPIGFLLLTSAQALHYRVLTVEGGVSLSWWLVMGAEAGLASL